MPSPARPQLKARLGGSVLAYTSQHAPRLEPLTYGNKPTGRITLALRQRSATKCDSSYKPKKIDLLFWYGGKGPPVTTWPP